MSQPKPACGCKTDAKHRLTMCATHHAEWLERHTRAHQQRNGNITHPNTAQTGAP